MSVLPGALAAVSCPACFALMFQGAVHCPACGARAARTPPRDGQSARALSCPGCGGVVSVVAIGDTTLRECGVCDGIWMDAATFERVCAERELQAAVLHQYSSRPPVTAAAVRYRPCPECGKLMNRLNFGRLSGTVIDVCRGHGTFLDAGELHLIAAFVQQGGLARTRQRELDDLREERQRLLSAEAQLARERRRHPDPRGDWSAADLLHLLDNIRG